MTTLVQIAPDFAFLAEMGFPAMERRQDPGAFGNAHLLLEGPHFSIRFDRDRGQVFVDVGGGLQGWYKLEDVLQFLDDAYEFGDPPDTRKMALALQALWGKVLALFGDSGQLNALRAFSKKKSEQVLSHIFRTRQ